MAGAARFERTNDGVKVRCLTAWLRPNAYASENFLKAFLGWIVGLEPTTSRATIWHSSQLNYIHHAACVLLALPAESRRVMPLARLQGFEPGTYGLEGRCSILLSYRRIAVPRNYSNRRLSKCQSFFHLPQHFVYFLPLPHGHGSFLPILGAALNTRDS